MALFHRNRVLGIDISTSAVKLLELSRTGQRYQVESCALERLPQGAMAERNVNDPEQVGMALRHALRRSGSKLRQAAVAVPTSGVITRSVPMPSDRSDEEIESEIRLEAAKYIPYSLDEVYMDFAPQGPSETVPNAVDIMIVASRRENVEARQEALELAGLKAQVVDVEAYALESAFQLIATNDEELHSARVAVVDIGATLTTLSVISSGETIYTREQNFGCEQLTAAIMETYKLSREQAEIARRERQLPADYDSRVLEPFLGAALDQIRHALQFFTSASHYNSVDRLLLIGGGALLKGMPEYAAQHLRLPTRVGNPFEYMTCGTRIDREVVMNEAPLFMIASGLAARSFD